MGTFSIWHWLIVLVIVLLLFGRDRIPKLAGDLAKGIKEFRSGMKEDTTAKETTTTHQPIENATAAAEESVSKDKTAA